MTQNKTRRIIAVLLAILAVAAIVVGAMNLPKRSGEQGSKNLRALRIRTDRKSVV